MKNLYILFLLTPFLLFAQDSWVKTNGPFGGAIEGFASRSTGELYAVNNSGIFKSTNNSASWFLLTDEVANINTIEIAPSGRIYLGTDIRGVWWSDNEGISWDNNQITHNPHSGLGASINNIKLNPSGHIFVSHWRSMNGGGSWFELSIHANDYLFLSGNEILAATAQGIQKSNDSGNSWFPLNNRMGSIQTNCIKKTSSNILIAGTNGSGVYISDNNGVNWIQTNSGLTNLSILELGVDADNRIYASTQGGMFISIDDAASWQQISLGFYTGWFYDFDIINGNELFSSTQKSGILYSNNNGLNWNAANNGIPVLAANKYLDK